MEKHLMDFTPSEQHIKGSTFNLPLVIVFFMFFSSTCIKPSIPVECVAGSETKDTLIVVNALADSFSTIAIDSLYNNTENMDICLHSGNTGRIPSDLKIFERQMWMVNSADNSLTKHEIRGDRIETDKSIYLGASVNPIQLAFDFPVNDMIYITGWLSHEILFVDTLSETVTGRVSLIDGNKGNPYPTGIASVNDYIAVSNVYYQPSELSDPFGIGEIVFINKLTSTIEKRISTCVNPQYIFFDPAKQNIHVICAGNQGGNDGKIDIISTSSTQISNWMVINQIDIGGSPGRYFFDSTTRTMYLAGVGAIMAYDTDTFNIINGFSNPIIKAQIRDSNLFTDVFFYESPFGELLISADFNNDNLILNDNNGVQSGSKYIPIADGTQLIGLIPAISQ